MVNENKICQSLHKTFVFKFHSLTANLNGNVAIAIAPEELLNVVLTDVTNQIADANTLSRRHRIRHLSNS